MLEGKVALVTGGSRGIGRAIALELANEGADIIINHLRHRSAAQETAEEIRQKGRQAHIIRANVGEPEKIEAMFAEIADKFGHLDILVNNAASGVARKAMGLRRAGLGLDHGHQCPRLPTLRSACCKADGRPGWENSSYIQPWLPVGNAGLHCGGCVQGST